MFLAASPASTSTTNSLRFNKFVSGGQTFNVSGTCTLQSGGILFGGAGDATISGGTLATAGEMIVHTFVSNQYVINSAISAPSGLTKGGPAQLTLGGSTSGIGGPVNAVTGTILRITGNG